MARLLILISRLPWKALYLLSDFLFIVIFYVVGYRRKVVSQNIERALSGQSTKLHQQLIKAFYRNLSDMFVETLKMLTWNGKSLPQRFELDVTELETLHAAGHQILLVLGHQFNWEWGCWRLNQLCSFPVYAVYTPLSNPIINRLVIGLRSRLGTRLVALSDGMYHLKNETPGLTALSADQNPPQIEKGQWLSFFGTVVPFHSGFERIARITGAVPVFIKVEKIKRGYYRAECQIPFQPGNMPHEKGAYLQAFVNFLEDAIRKQPENYLWSHNRWKYAPKMPVDKEHI